MAQKLWLLLLSYIFVEFAFVINGMLYVSFVLRLKWLYDKFVVK